MNEENPEYKIKRLKEELAKAQSKTPEPLKEEVPKEEPPKAPEAPKPPKHIQDLVEKAKAQKKFVPPDPLAKIAKEFEGGIWIEWIDNRYHINGIRGIAAGNKVIVRSLEAVDNLIKYLGYARKAFSQEEMISTKK